MAHTKRRVKGVRKSRKHISVQKMACSPVVDDLRVKDSCYTPKILLAIRDAYNKDHSPEEQIHESDPEKLWVILKDRFVHCQKEDCWLNAIKDEQLRKRIDRYIFAPDKPYEWKKNPNEWLSNYDIMNVLEQYEERYKHFEFIGPTPIDFDSLKHGTCVYNELCKFDLKTLLKKGKTKIGIVFNLSPSTSSGSHWVSMFIDTTHKVIFFFDSAGETIPKEIKVFVERVQAQAKEMGKEYTYYENHPQEHQFGNTECGVYSLFFIITMLSGRTELHKGRMSMKQKIGLFQHKTIKDEYIEKYRNVYFND